MEYCIRKRQTTCVQVYIYICVCLCVCLSERQRLIEKDRYTHRQTCTQRETGRESIWVATENLR